MNKKIVTLLLCAILAVSLFAGCTSDESGSTPDGTLDVTDMMGNALSLTISPDDKIVSLTPAGTEIVFALGAGGKLVGVDAFSTYPEETQQIEVVGDFNGPDVEKIISLEPNIVLSGNTLQQDSIDQLNELGLQVVCVEATTFEQIPEAMTLVGELLQTPDEAAQVVQNIDNAIAAAKEHAPTESKSVYYAMSYGDMGYWTSGPGSFINTMIELAGGTCVTADGGYPWIEYPVEDLVAANPDIILIASDSGDVESFSATPGLGDLDAVKNGAVYVVDADVLSRPGPRIAEAVAMISDILNK